MCCCGKPTINGQPGYSWEGKSFSICPVNPPPLMDGDVLLYDEPGRCGGIDSHSHHYRVVLNGAMTLLRVRHGGGDEEVRMSLCDEQVKVLAQLDSNGRYWILNALYHAFSQNGHACANAENERWRQAAAEKRIKVRKLRGQDRVRVWIEPKKENQHA